MVILKYTIETRLYKKNNKDIINYFDEIVKQYNYIFRKIYYKLKNDNTIKESELCTKIQEEYNINKRTSNSIIKLAKGRINSIIELKKYKIKTKEYKLEKIKEKLNKLISNLEKSKIKAKENKLNEKELIKYRNLKIKIAWLKIRKDKLINKINSLNKQLKTKKFKLTFGTKKLFKKDIIEFLNKRDNQIFLIGSKDEISCNSNCQLKYISKINQFIIKIRKDFNNYKQEKGKDKFVYGKCYFKKKHNILKFILKEKNSPLSYRIIKRDKNYYLQCIFEINNNKNILTRNNYGTIGIDFNKGFIAIS